MDALVVVAVFLLLMGVMSAVAAVLQRGLRGLLGVTNRVDAAPAGPLERAHAEIVLAHFEEIRAAAIAGDWERFHALNAELQVLDPRAWAEFNDGLEAANIPSPSVAKPRRDVG